MFIQIVDLAYNK